MTMHAHTHTHACAREHTHTHTMSAYPPMNMMHTNQFSINTEAVSQVESDTEMMRKLVRMARILDYLLPPKVPDKLHELIFQPIK